MWIFMCYVMLIMLLYIFLFWNFFIWILILVFFFMWNLGGIYLCVYMYIKVSKSEKKIISIYKVLSVYVKVILIF